MLVRVLVQDFGLALRQFACGEDFLRSTESFECHRHVIEGKHETFRSWHSIRRLRTPHVAHAQCMYDARIGKEMR